MMVWRILKNVMFSPGANGVWGSNFWFLIPRAECLGSAPFSVLRCLDSPSITLGKKLQLQRLNGQPAHPAAACMEDFCLFLSYACSRQIIFGACAISDSGYREDVLAYTKTGR